ncbi:MAG: hypothetical protein GY792_07595 [Gammaproteobacteria bacterium]|nr:hypothetical protein [Gammaproteobacteria bacterium]
MGGDFRALLGFLLVMLFRLLFSLPLRIHSGVRVNTKIALNPAKGQALSSDDRVNCAIPVNDGHIESHFFALVLRPVDIVGFSVPVVFRSKAQCAGNGCLPCQTLQRRGGTPQARPKGWSVSAQGGVAPLAKGTQPFAARRALP